MLFYSILLPYFVFSFQNYFPNMSSDEEDINQRRFTPISASDSCDQTTSELREILNSDGKQSDTTGMTEIGQYLEFGRREREDQCSQK